MFAIKNYKPKYFIYILLPYYNGLKYYIDYTYIDKQIGLDSRYIFYINC